MASRKINSKGDHIYVSKGRDIFLVKHRGYMGAVTKGIIVSKELIGKRVRVLLELVEEGK